MGDLFEISSDWLPAISMWQPYASLVFETDPAFRKAYETRSFRYPAKYDGGRLAIQASGSFPSRARIAEVAGAERERALHALAVRAFGHDYRRTLPLGAYLGTCILGGCDPTEVMIYHVGSADHAAGIWSDGRFAWRFDDPQPLAEPIPVKGKQGWWKASSALFHGAKRRADAHGSAG